MPSSLSRRITSNSCSTSPASRLEVGSSRISTLGGDVDGPGDRHHLLDGQRVRAERRRDVEVEVEPGQQLGRAPAHLAPPDAAEAARLAADEDVLRHREVRAEVDLLVDRADPGLLRLQGTGEGDRGAGQLDLARVDVVHAGEHLDERRLAGAVLAHQRVHLAREEPEVDVGQRLDAGELLADPGHPQDRVGCGHAIPFPPRRRTARQAARRVGYGGWAGPFPAAPA